MLSKFVSAAMDMLRGFTERLKATANFRRQTIMPVANHVTNFIERLPEDTPGKPETLVMHTEMIKKLEVREAELAKDVSLQEEKSIELLHKVGMLESSYAEKKDELAKLKDSHDALKQSYDAKSVEYKSLLDKEARTHSELLSTQSQLKSTKESIAIMTKRHEQVEAELRNKTEILDRTIIAKEKKIDELATRLLTIQATMEQLSKKCPQDASAAIGEAVANSELNHKSARAVVQAASKMEYSAGESKESIVDSFSSSIAENHETKTTVVPLKQRMREAIDRQTDRLKVEPLSMKARLAGIKVPLESTVATAKTSLSERLAAKE